MKLVKTQEHQIMGVYKPTPIDDEKKKVDFLIKQVNPIFITWNKDGSGEIVTKRQLEKYKKNYSWTTDF